jgi:hypothetical protein
MAWLTHILTEIWAEDGTLPSFSSWLRVKFLTNPEISPFLHLAGSKIPPENITHAKTIPEHYYKTNR